jgi:BirA family transcriptional regulator, biotin operon repressor / biotin---[acetyl-CoA-carboxylase] ligase
MNGTPALEPFYRLLLFERIDSTMTEARRLAAAGAPEGTIVWALEQTAGRGRRGRSWSSPPGNLYASVLLRPDCGVAAAAQLGFVAALAVAEAARAVLPPRATVTHKWPNDVLVDGRKLSGILLESRTRPSGELAWVVVGIGINLATAPDGAHYPTAALARLAGRVVAPAEMLERLAPRLLFWYRHWDAGAGFAAVRQAWLRAAKGVGAPIRVRLEREELEGRFAGLDDDGALLLDLTSGRRRITAGDVFPAARA